MLQSTLRRWKRARVLSACAWLMLVLATTAACEPCPSVHRDRASALAIAREYLADYLRRKELSTDVAALEVIAERYQAQDRAWYFHFRDRQGVCDVEVAVPDCEGMELSGGGCEAK